MNVRSSVRGRKRGGTRSAAGAATEARSFGAERWCRSVRPEEQWFEKALYLHGSRSGPKKIVFSQQRLHRSALRQAEL